MTLCIEHYYTICNVKLKLFRINHIFIVYIYVYFFSIFFYIYYLLIDINSIRQSQRNTRCPILRLYCINSDAGGIPAQGPSHDFDIPLASRAINLPGVVANVVDIQDSKCEGRVNVTGEGSVSKRTVRYPTVRRTSRSTKGRGKASRIGRDSSRFEFMRTAWITERVARRHWTLFCDKPDRRLLTFTTRTKKQATLASRCEFTSLSILLQDGTRLISRC